MHIQFSSIFLLAIASLHGTALSSPMKNGPEVKAPTAKPDKAAQPEMPRFQQTPENIKSLSSRPPKEPEQGRSVFGLSHEEWVADLKKLRKEKGFEENLPVKEGWLPWHGEASPRDDMQVVPVQVVERPYRGTPYLKTEYVYRGKNGKTYIPIRHAREDKWYLTRKDYRE